jgi:O-antigen/teichoic acid export membrane protein
VISYRFARLKSAPIFWQSALAFVYRIAGAVVTFLFGVIFARLMSIEEYGVVMSLMSFGFIAATIGLVGQQIQLLREVPSLSARKEYGTINLLASRRLLITCIGSLTVMVIAGLAFVIGHGRLVVFGRWEYCWSLLLIPPLALIEMQGCLGRALGSVNLALVPKELLWRLFITMFGATLFFASGKLLTAAEVFVIAAGVLLVLVVGQQLYLRHLMDGYKTFTVKAMFRAVQLSDTLRTSAAFWVTSVVNILFATADVVIVSAMLGPEAGGYYYAANRLGQFLDFFMTAFAIGAAPYMARLHDERRSHELTRVTSGAALAAFGSVLAGLLVFSLLGNQLLMIFGKNFARSQNILMVLAVGHAVSAYLGVGSMALNMSGHQRAAMWIMTLTSIFGLFAAVGATWIFGACGTAATAALAVIAMKGWMAAHIYFADGVDLTATSTIRGSISRLTGRGFFGSRSNATRAAVARRDGV